MPSTTREAFAAARAKSEAAHQELRQAVKALSAVATADTREPATV
jgi:hypothetical protein